MSNIVLIFPQAESRRPVSLDRTFPPLGITKLATSLRKKIRNHVKLVDEAYHGLPNVQRGDIVGLSCTTLNSKRTEDLAKQYHQIGAKVIVGGPHVSKRSIQANQIPFFDHIVIDHGEEAFADIITGKNQARLIYGKTEGKTLPEPLPNLTLWDLKPYEILFENSFWAKEYSDIVFLETQRGCTQYPRCSYCVRGPKGIRRINHSDFWDIITEIHDARKGLISSINIPKRSKLLNGKILIFDFSDEFFAMGKTRIEKLQDLANRMPKNSPDKVEFLAYARPDQIDSPKIPELMKKIGVTKLSIGVESGNPKMLVSMNRQVTLDDHRKAVKMLSECGIKIYINFLIGGFEETKQSLRNSIDHFKELIDISKGMVYRAGARLVIPFPGSKDFERLSQKTSKFDSQFALDPVELEESYLSLCTNISMDEAIKAHQEMFEYAKSNGVGMSDKPYLS